MTLIVALSMVALLGFAGLAVDTGIWYAQKSETQSAADAAAISAAKEMIRLGAAEAEVVDAAYFAAALNGAPNEQISVHVAPNGNRITVTLDRPVPSFFSRLFRKDDLSISARAVVEVTNDRNARRRVCVIVLDPAAAGTLNVHNGHLVGEDCEVHVHSDSLRAILSQPLGRLSASRVCVRGGVVGGLLAFIPLLDRNCNPLPDPFAGSIALPAMPTECSSTHGPILEPGRYCDGISGDKILNPGVYIIDGGRFGRGNISGDGVTVILRNDAQLNVGGNDTLRITAPTSGPYKGIAIFEDSDRPGNQAFVHGGPRVGVEGTIYLPKSTLRFTGNAEGGIASAWTLLVVYRIDYGGQPRIRVTADYESGTVPPPEQMTARFTLVE
ncbi:MAG: pilus assembly protein TadG-related protein [Alphaproteobacteria bacterium]